MNKVFSDTGNVLLGLDHPEDNTLASPAQFAEYTVILITEGEGIFHADFASFPFTSPVILFSTPQQSIYIKETKPVKYVMLQFHSDFYCIEYHRNEVACNGLLFNNIYIEPSLKLSQGELDSYLQLIRQINDEFKQPDPSDIVLRAYLQLFLAKSSSIKIKSIEKQKVFKDEKMDLFKQLLEENFLTLHKPSDYASLLAMTPNNFTKQCTRRFNKTPSQLIQERLILEAKKQLHLTRLSIKEIAFALKFQDEYYFSRVFKKMTKISPQTFRNTTGISIVADLSI
ncbi:helix-turn-helix domain-containing protein [Flavobacterium circumlabens]|uniref:AraC-like DNA-binding protein n=1 Tax=Flavobacterium circumlabens TaxID=2133765 RepID=A0A4Y7UAV8_9FLAO|nr:AraC family transcriptional regulator [Flavobacterium circumlabens]TCN55631.1 AraC-like DNA-binding protein [Flavobacterium circumlabens]TEB42969.1 helix-turn-helix domain-containing protein [Flavobacterium circumlabens]